MGRDRPPPVEDILAARAYDERLKAAKQTQSGDAPADDPAERPDGDRSEESESWPRFGDHRDEGVTDEKVKAAYERMVQREGTPEVQAAQEIAMEREAFEKYGPPARALSGAEVREFNQRIRAQQAADTNDDNPRSTNESRVQYSSPELPPRPLEKPPKHRSEVDDECHGGQTSEGTTDVEERTEQRWSPERQEWIETMPGAEHAVIDDRKFRSYAMDPNNTNNGGKHKAWEQLGYDVGDEQVRDELSAQIAQLVQGQVSTAEVAKTWEAENGQKYRIHFEVEGPEKKGTLKTIWLQAPGSDAPRLITNWLEVHKERDDDQ